MLRTTARHRAPKPARNMLIGTLLVVPLLIVFGFASSGSPPPQSTDQALTAAAQTAPGYRPHKREQPPPHQVNPNCTLAVPADPLSAQGLATPYELTGSGNAGACHEANADQSAFVEATILDPATGALSVYHPLVVDSGTRPAARPVMPVLPANAVVGIWFGFNGDTLTLRNAGQCVNGSPGSPFGQFGYCGAPAFFAAANAAVAAGKLAVPGVGTGTDGLLCPTVRDFGVADQDQSDNVTATYVARRDGRTAQPGQLRQAGTTTLTNGSDNGLLDNFIDPALNCKPFTAPDLTNNRVPTTSLALNELQAAAHQARPAALVPLNDPMTQVNGQQSVAKTNLYRAGVDQPPVNPRADTPTGYCGNLTVIANRRLATDRGLFHRAPSPDAGAANLFDFLTQRLQTSMQLLNCAAS